jgi:hypothetical protein
MGTSYVSSQMELRSQPFSTANGPHQGRHGEQKIGLRQEKGGLKFLRRWRIFFHGLHRTLGLREKDKNGLSPAVRLYKRSRTTPRDIKWRASGTKPKAETPSTLPVDVSL